MSQGINSENRFTENKGNVGFKYGLIAGAALSVFYLILYKCGIEIFVSGYAYIGYLIIIGLAVFAGIRQRNLNGGTIEFGEALKIVFTVFALAFLLQTIVSYILFNYVDVAFKEAYNQKTLQTAEEILKRLGTPQDKIDDTIDELSKKDNFSIGNILLGYGSNCILFFLVSLIIAAIIKRKPAPFENTFNQA